MMKSVMRASWASPMKKNLTGSQRAFSTAMGDSRSKDESYKVIFKAKFCRKCGKGRLKGPLGG